MLLDDYIKKLFQEIQYSVDLFGTALPEAQIVLYKNVLSVLRKMSTNGDNIISSVGNLKLINSVMKEFDAFTTNSIYQDNIIDFIGAFDVIADINNQYFSDLTTRKFTISKVLNEIKNQSIDASVNGLLDTGVNLQLKEGMRDLLVNSITKGASWQELVDQMNDRILTDTGEGSLLNHTKQITNDLLNQFSRRYNATLAFDLGLDWFVYVGSNIVTSRQWCIRMTEKRYVHRSELDIIINDNVNGIKICSAEIKCSQTTGLPYGMIEGTNVDNIEERCGGYNCGHHLIPVGREMIPASLLAMFP